MKKMKGIIIVSFLIGITALFAQDNHKLSKQELQNKVMKTKKTMDSAQKAIVGKVFADAIDTTVAKPTEPDKVWGQGATLENWGVWIAEVAGLYGNKWQILGDGISLKECGSSAILWIDTTSGYMHFNPSKLDSKSDFCILLKASYRNDKDKGVKSVNLTPAKSDLDLFLDSIDSP